MDHMKAPLKLRHFILSKDIERFDEYTFTAKGIYEFFSATTYPSRVDLFISLGLYFLEPGTEYKIGIKIFQNGVLLGGWRPTTCNVDKPNELINLHFKGDDFPIPQSGLVEFRILDDNELIDTQFVDARVEGR